MPQFDVFRTASGDLLLDFQSDALGYLASRMVAPLIPIDKAPERRVRLNPVFEIDGESYTMGTQFATAVQTNELRGRITNLGSISD